ncbi:hypothetical protein M514_04144, partial [Trichuris suis]
MRYSRKDIMRQPQWLNRNLECPAAYDDQYDMFKRWSCAQCDSDSDSYHYEDIMNLVLSVHMTTEWLLEEAPLRIT